MATLLRVDRGDPLLAEIADALIRRADPPCVFGMSGPLVRRVSNRRLADYVVERIGGVWTIDDGRSRVSLPKDVELAPPMHYFAVAFSDGAPYAETLDDLWRCMRIGGSERETRARIDAARSMLARRVLNDDWPRTIAHGVERSENAAQSMRCRRHNRSAAGSRVNGGWILRNTRADCADCARWLADRELTRPEEPTGGLAYVGDYLSLLHARTICNRFSVRARLLAQDVVLDETLCLLQAEIAQPVVRFRASSHASLRETCVQELAIESSRWSDAMVAISLPLRALDILCPGASAGMHATDVARRVSAAASAAVARALRRCSARVKHQDVVDDDSPLRLTTRDLTCDYVPPQLTLSSTTDLLASVRAYFAVACVDALTRTTVIGRARSRDRHMQSLVARVQNEVTDTRMQLMRELCVIDHTLGERAAYALM